MLRLRPLFAGQTPISVFHGAGPAATAHFHLDAVFLTGMHASYWGVTAMNADGARVLSTPPEKRALGLPARFVAGWLLPEGTANDPSSFGVRYAELLLEAVDTYNNTHPTQPIVSIGSIPAFLGLNTEGARRVAAFLKEALSGRRSNWEELMLPEKLSA